MTKEKLNSEVEALLPKSKPCKKCKQVAIARENLHKLSCLGNGDQLGNSTGNCLAQDTLDDMDRV